MWRIRFTFLLLLLVMAGPGCQPQNQLSTSHKDCRPTYRLIRSASVEPQRTDIWRYELNGTLIGCEGQLETLSATDMAMIRARVMKRLDHRRLMSLMKINMKEVRDQICNEINASLGGQVVSDVFFFHVQYEENKWFSAESQ